MCVVFLLAYIFVISLDGVYHYLFSYLKELAYANGLGRVYLTSPEATSVWILLTVVQAIHHTTSPRHYPDRVVTAFFPFCPLLFLLGRSV